MEQQNREFANQKLVFSRSQHVPSTPNANVW